MIAQIVFFLEEPSAKEMLAGILPRLLPEYIGFRSIVFEGKQDLEKQLPKKLRAWQQPNCRFIVVRDKDSADCEVVKQKLQGICNAAGKPNTLVRIACHELESWYLGDLQAVETGLSIKGLAKKQQQQKYRDPDRLANPKQELKIITENTYQQIAGSRRIAPYMKIEGNCSVSFNVFLMGVKRLIKEMEA